MTYYGLSAINSEHNGYTQKNFVSIAIQYIKNVMLKNRSAIRECYPKMMRTDVNWTDIQYSNDVRIKDCGDKHKCLSSYGQYEVFGYPIMKRHVNYSISIEIDNASREYADKLCALP